MTAFLFLRVVAIIAVCLYLAACILLYLNQARFLFPGAFLPFPAELEDANRRSGFQATTIPASDGETLFLLRLAPLEDQPVVILFHGNASYPEDYGFLYANWIGEGYGIVAPAARGYPRSSGKPEGEKMLADALTVYDFVAKSHPGHKIYVVGQSLGSAPAVHVAAHRPVARLVLISPFKSMLSLVWSKLPYFPITWLLQSPLRNDLDMPLITAPTLIVHGDKDELVPIESARQLAALAKTSIKFDVVSGAGHAIGLFSPETIDQIDTFLGIDMP